MHLPGSFLFVQNRRYPNDPPCMAYFSIYIRHSESNKCPVSIFIIISRSFYAPQILSDLISIDLSHLTSYLQASGFMKKRCYQKKKTSTRCESQVFHPLFRGLAFHSQVPVPSVREKTRYQTISLASIGVEPPFKVSFFISLYAMSCSCDSLFPKYCQNMWGLMNAAHKDRVAVVILGGWVLMTARCFCRFVKQIE